MAEKKREEFVVTDRRKFTFDGDTRPDAAVEPEPEAPAAPAAPAPEAAAPPPAPPTATPEPPAAEAQPPQVPEPPSAAERSEQHAAYSASGKKFNDMAATATGRTAKDFEMTFEKVVVSLYMTALMQLGLMQQEGASPPRADLIGAKQTIDTLGVLSEKTKGNLSVQEENLLQNCLYELRMAFIEITNAIARGPAPGAPGAGKK